MTPHTGVAVPRRIGAYSFFASRESLCNMARGKEGTANEQDSIERATHGRVCMGFTGDAGFIRVADD